MIKASIILPVYNAQKTLREAIDSILNQTYEEFELIIINDGSTDESHNIIKSYNDNRIIYLKNNGNKGLIYSLNRGIDQSNGVYIIRMDSDDICLPYRLERQIEFMDHNPDIAASGTQIEKFGKNHINQDIIPQKYEDLQYYMISTVPIYHPTAIIRRESINKFHIRYNEHYKYAEDYNLWKDMLIHGLKIANLDSICLRYRVSESQISSKYNNEQLIISHKIRTEYLTYFLEKNGFALPDVINDKYIRKYWDGFGSIVKRDEMRMILFYLYMNLSSPGLRVLKSIISGDICRISAIDMKWGIRLILSPFVHKWDYLSLKADKKNISIRYNEI